MITLIESSLSYARNQNTLLKFSTGCAVTKNVQMDPWKPLLKLHHAKSQWIGSWIIVKLDLCNITFTTFKLDLIDALLISCVFAVKSLC